MNYIILYFVYSGGILKELELTPKIMNIDEYIMLSKYIRERGRGQTIENIFGDSRDFRPIDFRKAKKIVKKKVREPIPVHSKPFRRFGCLFII